MKVAYILPSLQKPSGWRTHSVAFLRAICKTVEPVIWVSRVDFEAAKALFAGFEVFSLPVTQGASLSTWLGWRDLAASYFMIQQSRYPIVDLVHSLEAYPTGLVGSWLARKQRSPHLLTTHGTYGVVWYGSRVDRRAYERVLRTAQVVCPVSQGTAQLLQRYFSRALANTRLQPILNGNDFYKSVPVDEAMQRASPPVPTVLSVGDVKPRKGQHTSLAAFERVKRRLPQARYWIVGNTQPNDYVRRLQQFVADHGLQEVAFLGAVSDEELRQRYRQATVFMLTPEQDGLHFEGFGLVYLEAGAYGLPVIATRSGGVADAVQDGVTGFLAEAGDIEGLAEALFRLLTDPDLACRMGRANRRWAETLTWERNADEQVQTYREVLGRA